MDPAFQGRGVGGATLTHMLDELKEKGMTRVTLFTHPDNPAKRLYERYGFAVEGRVEDYEGSGTPRLIMARDL